MILPLLLSLALAAAQAPVPPGASADAAHPVVRTASGLRLETLEPAVGPRPTRKGAVRVEFEVRLADGTLVEAPAEPVGLSVSDVIPGLAEALLRMNQGGRYRVWVPAKLAYGKTGNADGSVPPDTDLVFTVRLLAVGRVAKQTH
jgi:FKBP-type peptidyl-prolyl cis-trans isomerase